MYTLRNWIVATAYALDTTITSFDFTICEDGHFPPSDACTEVEDAQRRTIVKSLLHNTRYNVRARGRNEAGTGPWKWREDSPVATSFSDGVFALVVPVSGDPPHSMAAQFPGAINSHRVGPSYPDANGSMTFDWIENPTLFRAIEAATSAASGTIAVATRFRNHRIVFVVMHDAGLWDGRDSASVEPAIERVEALAPHIGRVPLGLLTFVDTILLTPDAEPHKATGTDAWTENGREGFIGLNHAGAWSNELNGDRKHGRSPFEEIIVHEIGHLFWCRERCAGAPSWRDASLIDAEDRRTAGEPIYFPTEYGYSGGHMEAKAERFAMWFMLRCSTRSWLELREAVMASFPAQMRWHDEMADWLDLDLATGGGTSENGRGMPFDCSTRLP